MSHSTPPAANEAQSVNAHSLGAEHSVVGEHAARESVPPPEVPEVELGARIADGLFSRVYKAKSITAEGYENLVAVKVWKPHRAKALGKSAANGLLHLKHVNVVRHWSEGTTASGSPFVVMEYAAGQTLAALLRHGPIEVSRAVAISRQLARALVALHGSNMVHGDLKPNHVIIVEDERHEDLVKLCDVGLKPLDLLQAELDQASWEHQRAYVAPERLQGEASTQRSDLYSAGVILFEMLTGGVPAEGEPATKLVGELPRYVPRAIKDVVLRLLQKEPALRFSSAEQWLTALDQIDGRNQDDDESYSSSPRSAFMSSGLSRTAPPGSVRAASSLRSAPWGLDARGFKWWATACGLAVVAAAAFVGYRAYKHPELALTAAIGHDDDITQTTNAQAAAAPNEAAQAVNDVANIAPEARSAQDWLTLCSHYVDTAQLERAEDALRQAIQVEPTVVRGSRPGLLARRLGERRLPFLEGLEADQTLPSEVAVWARNNR